MISPLTSPTASGGLPATTNIPSPPNSLIEAGSPGGQSPAAKDELEAAFTQFVGQTLFGTMLKAMRSTVGEPAYFHGGRAEEIFQGQLDEHIVSDLTESTADSYASPMFELFELQRR